MCVLIEVENSSSLKEREEITYYHHEIFLWLCICFATFLFPCDDSSLLSLGDNFATNDNYCLLESLFILFMKHFS